jgi:Spy/CpxP family protein refolding chaperone
MKKIMLLLAAAALVSTAALAQPEQKDQKDQKDYKKERAEWETKIKTELNLTTEQVAKFDALSKEYNEKLEAIAQDATLTPDVQKEKKMALKKEKETKFMELLTTEQQAKYKEIIEKKKKEMSNKPSGS